MSLHRCPQCAAPMRTDFIGALSDKVLRCDHCGTILDVPDESTVEQSTTTREVVPGRTVTTTRKRVVTRRDGVGERGADGDAATLEVDLGDREQAIRRLREFARGHAGDGVALNLENLELLVEDLAGPETEIPDELAHRLQGLLREGDSASLGIAGLIGLSAGSGSVEQVIDSREITISMSTGMAAESSPHDGIPAEFAAHGRAASSAARRLRPGSVRPPLWMVVVVVTVVVMIAIAALG